jgi:hypothetical protein
MNRSVIRHDGIPRPLLLIAGAALMHAGPACGQEILLPASPTYATAAHIVRPYGPVARLTPRYAPYSHPAVHTYTPSYDYVYGGATIDGYRYLDDLATGRGMPLAKPWMRPLR